MSTFAMTSSSTWDLVTRLRAGETGCLEQIWRRYVNYLRVLAEAQLEPRLRSRVSASDVLQETLLDAHRDVGQFRGTTEAEFAAWLRQILVRNLAREVERHVLTAKRDVRRERSLERLMESVERSTADLRNFLAAPQDSPSMSLEREHRSLIVANALAKLPATYRTVVIGRNFQGRPFEELAADLGRSAGATRMLWLRALTRLKELLAEESL